MLSLFRPRFLAIPIFLIFCNLYAADSLTITKADSGSSAYIIRPKMKLGALVGVPILIDGKLIGKLKTSKYLEIKLPAGSHDIQVGSGDPIKTLLLPQTLKFDVSIGSTSYIILSDGMVEKNGNSYMAMTPKIIDETLGKEELSKTKKTK
jgi:hypothetical protein